MLKDSLPTDDVCAGKEPALNRVIVYAFRGKHPK